jgi:hypothetical protein
VLRIELAVVRHVALRNWDVGTARQEVHGATLAKPLLHLNLQQFKV